MITGERSIKKKASWKL